MKDINIENMLEYNKNQPIVEIYKCLQSEGKLMGVPHLLIRTTGCVLRCMFRDGGFCDSPYTSWSPEKGSFTLNDIIKLYKANPQIKNTMISGGAPTMHPALLVELCRIAHSFNHHVTLETEASSFVDDCNVDLVSISPKLSNSTPQVGLPGYNGKEITQSVVDRHEQSRKNYSVMAQWIAASKDYQIKPVVSSIEEMVEVHSLVKMLDIPKDHIYLMPAGVTNEQLAIKRVWLMELCIREGYNYSDRLHIIAYGDKRGV